MKPIDILEALGGVDESLVAEAESYRKPKRYAGYVSAAAVILAGLIMCTAYIRGNIGYTDGECLDGNHIGLSDTSGGIDPGAPPAEEGYCGAPLATDSGDGEGVEGYTIVSIFAEGEEMEYEPAPLYAATTSDDEMDEYVSGQFGREMSGIALFTAGGEDPSGAPRWYAVYDEGEISEFYWFSETENGYGRGWSGGSDYENAFNYLAHLTSEEEPLYLTRWREMLFAVIGDTAYYLPGSAFRPESDVLPYIDTDGIDVKVICLE